MSDLQSVSFRLTEEDLEAYVKFMTAQRASASKLIPFALWRLVLGFGLSLLISAIVHPEMILIGLSQPGVLLNIGIQYMIWIPIMFYLLRVQYQNIFNQQVRGTNQRASLQQTATVTIDAQSFLWRDESLALEIGWSRITQVTGDDAYIYIFSHQFSAFIIPRRAFGNPESARRFGAAVLNFWRQGHQTPPIPHP